MNRFEYIKEYFDASDLGQVLCDLSPDCESCPVGSACHADLGRGNWFYNWLKEEAKDWEQDQKQERRKVEWGTARSTSPAESTSH